ncbi:MAG: gamma carbonic anhydrase family protein [Candidatus Marinimicrobia bacterium]|nr:gamma carbonic anhydrase family protein [Candidatus Neomarinimicrobiota bacterium]
MIINYLDKKPKIADSAKIFPNVTIIGDVEVGENVNIWPNSVLRADINCIKIGENTNIQDGAVIHVDYGNDSTIIGKNVTVGHNCTIHGCKIASNTLIGMGATILSGAKIGEGSIIGAGALIKENFIVPKRKLIVGVPGKIVRNISNGEYEHILKSAEEYKELSKNYKIGE